MDRVALMRRLALVILFSAALVGIAKGQGDEDPSEIWMSGFLHIQDAVKAEAKNNRALAIGRFQEALWTFHDIARRFPAFESSRRTKRIDLLRDKIKSMGGIPIALEPLVRTPATVAKVPRRDPEVGPAKRPALPGTWVAKKTGAVVLPAVITPETRAYHAKVGKWWAENGRIETKLAHFE